MHTALLGYADISESAVKTPVWVNVGRTWLIILHHISRIKSDANKSDLQGVGLKLACYLQESIPTIMWVTDEASRIKSSLDIVMCQKKPGSSNGTAFAEYRVSVSKVFL